MLPGVTWICVIPFHHKKTFLCSSTQTKLFLKPAESSDVPPLFMWNVDNQLLLALTIRSIP